MGLSIVVSGAIVMFSLFFVMSAFPVIAENTLKVSQGSTEIAYIENQILHTNIGISSISANPGNQDISVTLDNTGNKKLWDYEKFDFIVTYDIKVGSQLVRVTEKLSFIESCSPSPGEWCLNSISNDIVDEGIINAGETATLDGHLSNNVHPNGGAVIIAISTDNGESTTDSVVV